MGAELFVRESLEEFIVGDIPDELDVDAALVLLLIAPGPFEVDGQKFPVCCRQLNLCTTSGSTGGPSALLTTSRKASLAMDPPRGFCRDGHMIQGKPCEPSTLRRCSVANPFPSNTSSSLGVRMMGVPSKSVPFLAAKAARAF